VATCLDAWFVTTTQFFDVFQDERNFIKEWKKLQAPAAAM
jgi:hypothetical protein